MSLDVALQLIDCVCALLWASEEAMPVVARCVLVTQVPSYHTG